MPELVMFVDPRRPEAREAAEDFGYRLIDLGMPSWCIEDSIPGMAQWAPRMVITFGGDGTLLRAIHGCTNTTSYRVMGVNYGKLGFLAEFTREELDTYLISGLRDLLPIRECATVIAQIKDSSYRAVNDIVFLRNPNDRMPKIALRTPEKHIATYYGDGLIVSTPIGSTAYNLSAGGPLMEPTLEALVLSPICPHTLSVRPMVVPINEEITVEADDPVTVSIDGITNIGLKKGDVVTIKRSVNLRLVTNPKRNYYDTLRTKLGWATR